MHRRSRKDFVDVHEPFGASEGEPTKECVVVGMHPSIVGRPSDTVCHSKSVDLEVLVGEGAGRSVVTVVGELDAHSAPKLQAHLDPLSERVGAAIVVDLSGVTFIDSTGLGVLVTTLKRVRETDGSLDVVATAPRVLKVFAITGLDAVIPVHATLTEAMPPA